MLPPLVSQLRERQRAQFFASDSMHLPPACHAGRCHNLIINNDEVNDMNIFKAITDTGEEVGVAARTIDHAALVFVTVWIGRTGTHPGAFSIIMGAPKGYEGDATVETIRRGDMAGMLVRQADGVMHFDPTFGGEHG